MEGISFRLGEQTFSPNDIVNMNDIGSGENGLIAVSTHSSCCSSVGNWFLPGSSTPITEDTSSVAFYVTRNENGELVLNRGNFPATSEGLFRVEIPNAAGDLTDVYIGLYLDTGGRWRYHIGVAGFMYIFLVGGLMY